MPGVQESWEPSSSLSAGAGAAWLWTQGCGAFLVPATDCQGGFTDREWF